MRSAQDEANLEAMIARKLTVGGAIGIFVMKTLTTPVNVGLTLYVMLRILNSFGLLAWVMRH